MCTIPCCLEKLLKVCNERTSPHKPPAMNLAVRDLDAGSLPIFLSPENNKITAIIDKEPLLGDPNGGILLWVCYSLPLTCNGAGDGHCTAGARLDVWQSDRFPLARLEVDWFIATYLNCPKHAWAQLPCSWLLMQRACAREGKVTVSPALHVARTPKRSGQCILRRSPGAPRLQATCWLEEKIAGLHDINDYAHLFDGWLDKYKQQVGRYPRSPERSFRQAAEGCIARITRRRSASKK